MSTKWSQRYAARTNRMKSSAIRELLKITQMPGVISFAGGLPAPDFFPTKEIEEATRRVLQKSPSQALQYGTTEGYTPLRELIVEHVREYGIYCDVGNVVVTSGSQQALDLIGKLMIDPGDRVIVEEPTYLGALQAWNAYQAEYVTVPSDEHGIQVDAITDEILAQDPKFLYTIPNFHNPTSATMPAERRHALIELAAKREILIVEDDPYGQLLYEGQPEDPLIVADANRREDCEECFISGNVLYLSTFSKTLCPGFRVAWIVGPEDVIGRLVQAKQGTDLHTSTFAQMVAYETARDGFLEKHIEELRDVYRERRDLMLTLLETHFEGLDVTWNHPKGGLFIWLSLPDSVDTSELLPKAVEQKVAFVPGSPFYPHGGGHNTMRLNFSNASPEKIEQGVERLASVLKAELAQSVPG